ncbi:MAG: NADPH-dependent oxidoreductase [Proteobacteria bacterium ST_bin15]|nr:MAG: NADPH-dependent oxidoreductase [Proteobacteria bacterium ST_bin15]
MSTFDHLTDQRFGDGGPALTGSSVPDAVVAMLSRRTIRRFEARLPDEALLDVLAAAALSASSKSDYQQVSLLRLKDVAQRAALAALFPAMPWIGAAPVFYVFLADARRLQRLGAMRGKPVRNGSLEGFFNASVDAALALQTMILAAEACGLGTCPISVLRNKIDTVATILSLPDLVFPVAGLCLGYPAGEAHVSLRLPRQITIHRDRYDDEALPAAIDDYDRRRAAIHAIPPHQQRAKARFGEAAFYGWSEDKTRHACEGEGAAFPKYLLAHGFDFS